MEKNPVSRTSRLFLLLTLFLGGIVMVYASQSFILSGGFGLPLEWGEFSDNGNAGQIIIPNTSTGRFTISADVAHGTMVMTGEYMWFDTVGWVKLTTNTSSLFPGPVTVRFITGSTPSTSTITEWFLDPTNELYGWSDNAGWIDFNPTDVSSGLIYRGGGISSFSGLGWSDTLGWIDFSYSNPDFMNKVKIIGNIGGGKAFDVVYNLGPKFDGGSFNSLMNTLRKNIALIERNIDRSKINTSNTTSPVKKVNNETIIYELGSDQILENISTLYTDDVRTVIVRGGDVVISEDIQSGSTARALIVMKDASGKGGDIYIENDVKNIYLTLIAEGSVYPSTSGKDKSNENAVERDNLGEKQLYIYGSLISRNTIGGSQIGNGVICPTTHQSECQGPNKVDKAGTYDLNYFRTYDPTDPANASDKSGYDDYSVIIEYDPRLLSSPPPGVDKK